LLPAVAVAGAVGALARYGVGTAVEASLPVATLLANLTGSLLLGVLVGLAPAVSWLRPVLGTGLLGGWTTWSGLAVETVVMGSPFVAAVYLLATLAGGLTLAAAGVSLAGRRRTP
jgi:CrcB protein